MPKKDDIKIFKGLENIYICETSISFIDGKEGKLVYRGIPVEVLAEKSTYEEVVFFLWFGHLPRKDELEEFEDEMKSARKLDEEMKDMIEKFKTSHPMDLLRTIVSIMGLSNSEKKKSDEEKALEIISKVPTAVAYHHRISMGEKPLEPSDELDHASNFYYMMTGRSPDEKISRIMNATLILHAEQGLNASTFSAIVISSTLSDLYSAITGAVGALKGPLHGGANEKVMELVEKIGKPENVESEIEKMIAQKHRIPGFGHRIYKTFDPRYRILKRYSKEMVRNDEDERYYRIVERMEEEVLKKLSGKGIFPNVDLYSGILYKFLGFDRRFYTAVFAVARLAGWIAHIFEYSKMNKIIRPCGYYVGPMDVEYKPLEERE